MKARVVSDPNNGKLFVLLVLIYCLSFEQFIGFEKLKVRHIWYNFSMFNNFIYWGNIWHEGLLPVSSENLEDYSDITI